MKETTKEKVHVFVNRRKVELETREITVEGLLAAAGFQPADFDLFLLQGEGDPSGGNKLEPGQNLVLKNGEHFRAIPKNRNFGRN